MAELKLGGRDITVKKLLVSDVRELLDETKEKMEQEDRTVFDLHAGDLMLDDEIPMAGVAKAIGWSVGELEGAIDPDELKAVVDQVRAKNPFYLGMMERLIKNTRGGLQKAARQETSSGRSVS